MNGRDAALLFTGGRQILANVIRFDCPHGESGYRDCKLSTLATAFEVLCLLFKIPKVAPAFDPS